MHAKTARNATFEQKAIAGEYPFTLKGVRGNLTYKQTSNHQDHKKRVVVSNRIHTPLLTLPPKYFGRCHNTGAKK